MSARVCRASATSTSLCRRRPARSSYHTTVRWTTMLTSNAPKLQTLTSAWMRAGLRSRSTALWISSQVVRKRREAMISAVMVSALRCP